VQATVHRFDPATGSGSVVTDDGLVIPFDSEAFAGSRLRHVRTGQRLTVQVEGEGPDAVVVALALGTVGRAPARPSRP
jgi:cold shock CspA family protein